MSTFSCLLLCRHCRQLSMWLSLFFEGRKDTKEACQETCVSVLSELAAVAREHADDCVKAELGQCLAWVIPEANNERADVLEGDGQGEGARGAGASKKDL